MHLRLITIGLCLLAEAIVPIAAANPPAAEASVASFPICVSTAHAGNRPDSPLENVQLAEDNRVAVWTPFGWIVVCL